MTFPRLDCVIYDEDGPFGQIEIATNSALLTFQLVNTSQRCPWIKIQFSSLSHGLSEHETLPVNSLLSLTY